MQVRGKSTIQPPPPSPKSVINFRIVLDERFDGALLGYITSPGQPVESIVARAIDALVKVEKALRGGKFTFHAVGTEAEHIEVIT